MSMLSENTEQLRPVLDSNKVPAQKELLSGLTKRSLLALFILNSSLLLAHGEHFDLAKQPQGPIHLSEEQSKIIDLKTATVMKRPLAQQLNLNGEMQLLPNEQANVSVRISGNVAALYANLGDKVKAGQPLIKVQSLLIGDPPPTTIMNAPMSGVIDARNVSLGQAVAPNTVLFHISNRSKLIAVAKVYEEDLGRVQLGQKAEVQVLSYPKQPFVGKVILIEPNLDTLTRTVNAQILVDNTKGLLKPGMFAHVRLTLQTNQNALAIPNSAVIEANGEKFVFKREGNNYRHTLIKTGIIDAQYTEILAGLAAGDEVITQGNRQLYTYWLTGGKPQPIKDSN